MDQSQKKPVQSVNIILIFLLVVAYGILINILGARLGSVLPFPVFLDSIGTILAASIGGYLPGVLVGFLSNFVNGLYDYTAMYYSVLSVLLALAAGFFSEKGFFKKPVKLIPVIIALSLIGGVLGFFQTWLLYGISFADGVSAPLALAFRESGKLSEFWAQFFADFLVDLLDKTISVLVCALVLRLIPEKLQKKLYCHGWQQTPVNREERKEIRKKGVRKISLSMKVVMLLSSAILIIASVVTGISYFLFHNANIEVQSKLGDSMAKIVASNIDAERVDEFLELGEEAEGYLEIKNRLSAILDSYEDVEFVYVYRILEDGCHVVFDPDTPELAGEKPGTVIPFDEAFLMYLPSLLEGKRIEPVISDETYGWLLTNYEPVYDKNGVCQCYAAADISMNELKEHEHVFLTRVVSLFIGFFILVLVFGVWMAKYNIVMPINSMALVAGSQVYDTEAAREDSVRRIENMKVRTGDEIENLYISLVEATHDTVNYIKDAQEKNEHISKLQNGMIMVLEDLVESRDECTGNHIRHTAAYARIILEQMKKDGIYTDRLTDKFVDDVVNSAPLHDVGKITVPDAILNKPGKLTDEEFARMKQHAMAGGEIINQAMGAVDEVDTGYLEEARNLAEYHHEKWNGTGYPMGLKGEEIPLSARIMAVADVFDALVSKRSYKEGFPFDKAMEIIKEGSGSHFDPKIVEAFVHAEEQVREVAESQNEPI